MSRENTQALPSTSEGLLPVAEPEAAAPRVELPEKPLVVIEPGRKFASVKLRELWSYRELFWFLVLRDIKIRYKQTVMGFAWVIFQPIFQTLIFSIFFGMIARIPSEGVPYPVFAFAGLLPWIFFSRAVGNSGNSLISSANLITKVYFPRIVIPAAAVGSCVVDFAVSFCVLLLIMAYYRVGVTWSIVMLPAVLLLLTLFALGIGMLTSSLNVKYRDMGQIVPLILQVWMYASPVVYPPTFVPVRWRWLLQLNPLTGILDAFRAALL